MFCIWERGTGVEYLLVLNLRLSLTEEGEGIAAIQDVGRVRECDNIQSAIYRYGGPCRWKSISILLNEWCNSRSKEQGIISDGNMERRAASVHNQVLKSDHAKGA